MGQIEEAIDKARRSGSGKSGPWTFEATTEFGKLIHYGTPIFRVNLKTGSGEVGTDAWGSVSDQTGIRKAAAHLARVLGITVEAKSKKEIISARERARSKGSSFSNPASGSRRLDGAHDYIGKGLVYCKEYQQAAPPKIEAARVRCALCGRTVQSIHGNPSKKHIKADLKAFDHLTKEMSRLKKRDVKELRRKNPVPSHGLLRAKFVRKGYTPEQADELARREVAQAEIFLSEPRRKNPVAGPELIYGNMEKVFMTKTKGPYKGRKFVHSFKPGVSSYGLPRGSKILFPGGKSMILKARAALLAGKKDLWKKFPA